MDKSTEIEKLFAKVGDSYTITNCQNGFVVEVSGQDSSENWITAKFVFMTMSELRDVVSNISNLPRS